MFLRPLVVVVALLLLSALTHPIVLPHRTIPSASRLKRAPPDTALEPGVYVLQFKQRIDSAGLRRIANVLSYEPHDYVPRHGVLVYVNSSAQALELQTALETRMARLYRLIAADRQANIGGTLHRVASRKQSDRFVIYRNQSRVGQPVRHDVPKDPNVVVLRAHVIGPPGEAARTVELPAIESCAATISRTKPVAHYVDETNVFMVRNVHRDDAAAVADELVRRFDNIGWIDVRQQFRLLNRWAIPAVERRTSAMITRDAGWRPFGTGRGQIVSISDTGIATTQCFFSDGLGARAGTVPRTSGTTTVPADTGHPKFRAYTSGYGGDFDDSNGHGTHTSGTLAGRAANGTTSALFNGVASDARLCFYDLLGANGDETLAVPDDIGTIFRWSADCGAYVHSGSWGADDEVTYNADDWAADKFVWSNRLFLPIFAAGNAGPSRGTTGAPSRGKNVLTIGATMNGIDALEMAVQRAPYAAGVYGNSRVADFSSRGDFDAQTASKVDLVTDGGAYVWSAAFDAPKSGSCTTSESVMGLEGSSMATPGAAGAAVLTQEWLLNTARLKSRPTGSLTRAILIASAQPTDGPYPSTAGYASYADRRNAEGFGRITLDQALTAQLRIVSNEEASLGLTRAGDVVRVCVAVDELSPLSGVVTDGTEMVVVLSYVDYPSAIGRPKADLVNDLDLIVRTANNGTAQSVNGLPPGTRELISTNERVVIGQPRAVDISVGASSVDFGGLQTFSLVVLLRGANAAKHQLTISTPQLLHGDGVSPCSLCGATQFVAKSDCVVCGDGVVNAPVEQCEPALNGAECCDGVTCKWLPRNTLCATNVGSCRVQGRCTADTPSASNSSMTCTPTSSINYTMKRSITHGGVSTFCESSAPSLNTSTDLSTPVDTAQPCGHSVAYWVEQLRTNASAYASDDDRLCCARFSAFAEQRVPVEPLYHQLALEFIATRLNAEQSVTSDQLIVLRTAQLLLEKQCASVGFTDASDREDAVLAIQQLQALALPICADEAVIAPETCSVPTRGTEVAELLCSGPPNRYIDTERRCACAALYQAGEPDCRDLMCSGNGASLHDYAAKQAACVCLPGWTGTSCQRCADAVAGARWLCVGVPTALVVNQHTHVLVMVLTSSVPSRLDGSFYAANVDKQADGLPGTAPLDCACRRQANRIVPSTFETHIEAYEAALGDVQEQAVLWAHAQPQLEARTTAAAVVVKQGTLVKLASSAQPRRLTSGTRRLCSVGVVALLIPMFLN